MVMQKGPVITETIYLAGGCLWGVQEFVRHLPGVLKTEAGRANGTSSQPMASTMVMPNVSAQSMIRLS